MDFLRGLEIATAAGIHPQQYRDIWLKEMEVKQMQLTAAASIGEDNDGKKQNISSILSQLLNQQQHQMNLQREQFESQKSHIQHLQLLQQSMQDQQEQVGGSLVEQLGKLEATVSNLSRDVSEILNNIPSVATPLKTTQEDHSLDSGELQTLKGDLVNEVAGKISHIVNDMLMELKSNQHENNQGNTSSHEDCTPDQVLTCLDDNGVIKDSTNPKISSKSTSMGHVAPSLQARALLLSKISNSTRKKHGNQNVQSSSSDDIGIYPCVLPSDRAVNVTGTGTQTEPAADAGNHQAVDIKPAEQILTQFLSCIKDLLLGQQKANGDHISETAIEELASKIHSLQENLKLELEAAEQNITKLTFLPDSDIPVPESFPASVVKQEFAIVKELLQESKRLTGEVGEVKISTDKVKNLIEMNFLREISCDVLSRFQLEPPRARMLRSDMPERLPCEDAKSTPVLTKVCAQNSSVILDNNNREKDLLGVDKEGTDQLAASEGINLDAMVMLYLMHLAIVFFCSNVPCDSEAFLAPELRRCMSEPVLHDTHLEFHSKGPDVSTSDEDDFEIAICTNGVESHENEPKYDNQGSRTLNTSIQPSEVCKCDKQSYEMTSCGPQSSAVTRRTSQPHKMGKNVVDLPEQSHCDNQQFQNMSQSDSQASNADSCIAQSSDVTSYANQVSKTAKTRDQAFQKVSHSEQVPAQVVTHSGQASNTVSYCNDQPPDPASHANHPFDMAAFTTRPSGADLADPYLYQALHQDMNMSIHPPPDFVPWVDDFVQGYWCLRPLSVLFLRRETVYSEMYVSPIGYAFRLVSAFTEKDTIHFALIPVCGPHDAALKWPVKFKVTLCLVNPSITPLSITTDPEKNQNQFIVTKTQEVNRPPVPFLQNHPRFLYVFKGGVYKNYVYQDSLNMRILLRITD